ncbi:hypothetical protein QQF64_022337 [Cirrhinus molitorella]|uniref:Uncharacterized protein n=1 Tax=Cirrhinus molitorella TaxID=172907 RepID=A0ABR3L7W9_9TELE
MTSCKAPISQNLELSPEESEKYTEYRGKHLGREKKRVAHNGLILEMDHPTSGRIAVPGPAVRFSSFECSNPIPPPVIGQHTVQVLRDTLGYSDNAINQLLASRTITQNKVH